MEDDSSDGCPLPDTVVALPTLVAECISTSTVSDSFTESYDPAASWLRLASTAEEQKPLLQALLDIALRPQLFQHFSNHALVMIQEQYMSLVSQLDWDDHFAASVLVHTASTCPERLRLALTLLHKLVVGGDADCLAGRDLLVRFLTLVDTTLNHCTDPDQRTLSPLVEVLAYMLDGGYLHVRDLVLDIMHGDRQLYRPILEGLLRFCCVPAVSFRLALAACFAAMYFPCPERYQVILDRLVLERRFIIPERFVSCKLSLFLMTDAVVSMASSSPEGARFVADNSVRMESLRDEIMQVADVAAAVRAVTLLEFVLPVSAVAREHLCRPDVVARLVQLFGAHETSDNVEFIEFVASGLYALANDCCCGPAIVAKGFEDVWIRHAAKCVHDDSHPETFDFVIQGNILRRLMPATLILLLDAVLRFLPRDARMRTCADVIMRLCQFCDVIVAENMVGSAGHAAHVERPSSRSLPKEMENCAILGRAVTNVKLWCGIAAPADVGEQFAEV